MLAISGRVCDSAGRPLPEAVAVEAFEESALGSRFDRHLGPAVPLEEGRFAITVKISLGINSRKVYLVLTDPRTRFASVRNGQNEFAPFADSQGAKKWRSKALDALEGVDVTVSLVERPVPGERYEAAVIGSGFGGSITALTLANKYAELRKALKGMPGVRGIDINYLLDTAKVRYDPNKLSLARIKAALK